MAGVTAIVFEFPSESQAVGRDALSVRVGGRQRRTLTDQSPHSTKFNSHL